MDFDALQQEYEQACAWLDQAPGPVHLLGIGGIGMAGLARLLFGYGFRVSGCDEQATALTDRLAGQGIAVSIGHDPRHAAGDAVWAVRSAAVPIRHPETQAFLNRGRPVFRRGVLLPALLRDRRMIAVGGTHGKTTTSGFLAQILKQSGVPYGFCIGGEIPSLGEVASIEKTPAAWIAVEADESDGTLALYESEIAVVTNIDFDHKENFGDVPAFEACFMRFVERTRGCVIYGGDDPVATRLLGDRENSVSFGLQADCDYHARILDQGSGWIRVAVRARGRDLGELVLPAGGEYNVRNALAALAAAIESGIPVEPVVRALSSVARPRRRFETLATIQGRRIISDYAHHPTEIRALMQSVAGESWRRCLTVFQPHRYSRTLALGDAFADAFSGDGPLVLLPVYAASESPVLGGETADLYVRFRAAPRAGVWLADSLVQVEEWLAAGAQADDCILLAGAGSVERIGLALVSRWTRKPPPEPDAMTAWTQDFIASGAVPSSRVAVKYPLAQRTTLGVGGAADLAVKVVTVDELSAVLAWTTRSGLPVHILGAGSNTVVSDLGVRGVVIRLWGRAFTAMTENTGGSMDAGAAVPLKSLVALSRSGRIGGFGFLAGIPGTVGGAIRMNAGIPGKAIGDRVVRVQGVDRDGCHWERDREAMQFGYRTCGGLNPGDCVLAVRLKTSDPDPRESKAIDDERGRRRWMRGLRTAGSVFRNPESESAGVLLDRAGCKALRIGGARVCREHANVIACDATACASDVLALMRVMQARVRQQHGIDLIPEINVWV